MLFRRKPKEESVQPDWIIVGLGNPGAEYRGTRHNVGFETIDRLGSRNGIKLERGRNRALIGTGHIGSVAVTLVKPLTYMNLSGQAVGPLARQSNVTPSHVLVIADDKDLAFAKLRLKMKGSAGGHNGHKSLIQSLGTQEYPRIKIGIGSDGAAIDHVLGAFGREEREPISFCIDAAVEVAETFVREGEFKALEIVTRYNASAKE